MRRRDPQKLLRAYGADPGRWPEEGDEAAAGLARIDPGRRREEAALDAALDRFTAPAPDPALLGRIVQRAAGLEQVRPRPWPALAPAGWPAAWARHLGARWPQMAALAAAAILGLVAGWSDPLVTPPPAVAEDLVVLSMLDGLE